MSPFKVPWHWQMWRDWRWPKAAVSALCDFAQAQHKKLRNDQWWRRQKCCHTPPQFATAQHPRLCINRGKLPSTEEILPALHYRTHQSRIFLIPMLSKNLFMKLRSAPRNGGCSSDYLRDGRDLRFWCGLKIIAHCLSSCKVMWKTIKLRNDDDDYEDPFHADIVMQENPFPEELTPDALLLCEEASLLWRKSSWPCFTVQKLP